MAFLIPAGPAFSNHTEREVWDRLAGQLRDEDVLLANITSRVTGATTRPT